MKVNYLILNKNFVKKGKKGGQATHAEGIYNGLIENQVNVKIFGPNSLKKFIPDVIVNKKKIPNSLDILGLISAKHRVKSSLELNPDYLIIRKCIAGLILFLITKGFQSLTNKKVPPIVWEVNNFSSIGSTTIFHFFLNQILLGLNLLVLNKSQLIYVVTGALKDKLITNNIDSKKIVHIPNGCPTASLANRKESESIQFLFFGVLKPYNNFKKVINSIETLRNISSKEDIDLTIVGYGEMEDYIKFQARNKPWINFVGPKTLKQLSSEKIIHRKSIGLIPMEDRNSALRSPIKLYEYLSLGIPVLISEKVILEKPIKSDICKIYNLSEKEMSNKMKEFLIENYDWDKAKEECIALSKENSWGNRMKNLIHTMQCLEH